MYSLGVLVLVCFKMTLTPEVFGCGGGSSRRSCSYRNCRVSSWGGWSSCSATCGTSGTKTKRRSVIQSSYCGGRSCPSLSYSVRCPYTCCPIPCSYYWASWSACSRTCGYGTKTRRLVIRRSPSCRGNACPASTSQSQRCGNGR